MPGPLEVADETLDASTQSLDKPWMTRRTIGMPWIDISDMVTWRDREGQRGDTHVAAAVLGDDTAIRIDSSPDGPTTVQFRPGGGQPASNPIEQAWVLRGTVLDASPLKDGRIFVLLHDTEPGSPTQGSLIGWIGTLDDLLAAREGQYTVRIGPDLGGTPIRGEVQVNPDSNMIGIRVDLDGPVPRQFKLVVTSAELDARVPTRSHDLPFIDLDSDEDRHGIVDRESGQYLGHPTTVLLEDGHTMLCVYPRGHGAGGIVYKRSSDGGRTWSQRLETPPNWSTSREVPTLHRVTDPRTGMNRLIMWSGLHPARLATSEDDGETWSPLKPVGDWGGIVVMGCVTPLADGRLLAMFHDDGRFITATNQQTRPVTFTLYQTLSDDGGLTWSTPEPVWSGQDLHLCEPGVIRSPDGGTLAVLLRENSRQRNSHIIFSNDEAASWSPPRELPAALTGDRHTGVYAPDGRLFISFRDTTLESPTKGDWVGWVGTWDDLLRGTPGQYRIRLKDNRHGWDCAYPGVELLPDGTIVTTTYGHWDAGESPYIRTVHLTLDELDRKASPTAP
jgi:hypothetical protein